MNRRKFLELLSLSTVAAVTPKAFFDNEDGLYTTYLLPENMIVRSVYGVSPIESAFGAVARASALSSMKTPPYNLVLMSRKVERT